jgi:hypothetical protein
MEERLSPLGVDIYGDESSQSAYSPGSCDYSDAEESKESKESIYSIREASEKDIHIAKELLLHSHPFKQVNHTVSMNARLKKKVVIDISRLRIDIKAFLLQLQHLLSCFNKTMQHYVKCSCVKKLWDINHDHAIAYLSDVASMSKRYQDALYKELINRHRHRSTGYNFRIGDDKDKGHSLILCQNAFLNILLIEQKRCHATLQETHFIPGANLHKNTGNNSATRSPELLNDVIDFIKDKGAIDGEVYATIISRTLTGHELRDKENGAVDLTSNTSCREMYEKFCFDRGWPPKSDSKGRFPKVCEYPNRKTDGIFWRDDDDQMEVCYWWSFREI